jgi:hypothetical protein
MAGSDLESTDLVVLTAPPGDVRRPTCLEGRWAFELDPAFDRHKMATAPPLGKELASNGIDIQRTGMVLL